MQDRKDKLAERRFPEFFLKKVEKFSKNMEQIRFL